MTSIVENRIALRNRRRAQPKYTQLTDHLRADLTSGRLRPGEALPTEVDLSQNFSMSRNTVRQALAELERDGLIRRIRGKGTFVRDKSQKQHRRDLDSLALVVNELGIGAHMSLLQGFEGASRDLSCQAIIRGTENDLSKQGDTLLQLLDRHPAGVALIPTTDRPTPPYHIRQLQEQGIPVVFCHRRVPGIQAPLLPIPFREVGRRAAQAFVHQGHRRMALFCPIPNEIYQEYVDGFREVVEAAGGELPEQFVFVGTGFTGNYDRQEHDFFVALKRICEDPDRPTGIFVTDDLLAELLYLMLDRLGLKIPEDISLVSEGGPWREGAITRKLTSVIVPEVEIGRQAVKLLQEMRDGKRPIDDAEEIVLPLEFCEGRTLGPVPGEIRRVQGILT